MQGEALKREFPAAQLRINHQKLEWTGELQPTPFSEIYTVEIDYLVSGRRPTVTVVSPKLVPNKDGKLPHIFPGPRLCLHHAADWDPSMLITRTIIPWASEWLFHYEFWQATGEWSGGGHQPIFYRASLPKEQTDSRDVKTEE